MVDEYEELKATVEVPPNTGIAGFLSTLEAILKMPRLQEININARGEVRYRYFLKTGEAELALNLDLETLMPAAVIRNSRLEELVTEQTSAPAVLGQLFDLASRDHLFPTVLVVGPNTHLWSWYTRTAGFAPVRRDELFGVPVLTERTYEDQTLVLCASYSRASALVDTHSSYKVVIPVPAPPKQVSK